MEASERQADHGVMGDGAMLGSDSHLLGLIAHAVDSATEMISVTDAENRFIYVNRAFLEGYGYRWEEVVGRQPAMLRRGEEDGVLGAEISFGTQHGGWSGELVNVRKDGSLLQIHLSTSIVRDHAGKISGLIGVARNIESQKRAELALRTAQSRFHDLFTDLDDPPPAPAETSAYPDAIMYDLAAGIDDLVGRMRRNLLHVMTFSSYASHELRSHLSAMRAQLEASMRKNAGAEELRASLMQTYNEILRLTRTTTNLINLSAMQAGAYRPKLVSVDLARLLEECCRDMEPLALERKIDLRCAPGAPLALALEPDLFRQVIVNLVHNALKHVPSGGTIEVAYHQVGGDTVLAVTDNGEGIDGEDLPYIFDVFYRGKHSQEGTPGSGLGLALAKWIVHVHGGSIDVASTRGGGTRFTITLPQAPTRVPS